MELLIWKKGFCFKGKVKDFRQFLASLPKDQTLAQYVAKILH